MVWIPRSAWDEEWPSGAPASHCVLGSVRRLGVAPGAARPVPGEEVSVFTGNAEQGLGDGGGVTSHSELWRGWSFRQGALFHPKDKALCYSGKTASTSQAAQPSAMPLASDRAAPKFLREHACFSLTVNPPGNPPGSSALCPCYWALLSFPVWKAVRQGQLCVAPAPEG